MTFTLRETSHPIKCCMQLSEIKIVHVINFVQHSVEEIWNITPIMSIMVCMTWGQKYLWLLLSTLNSICSVHYLNICLFTFPLFDNEPVHTNFFNSIYTKEFVLDKVLNHIKVHDKNIEVHDKTIWRVFKIAKRTYL